MDTESTARRVRVTGLIRSGAFLGLLLFLAMSGAACEPPSTKEVVLIFAILFLYFLGAMLLLAGIVYLITVGIMKLLGKERKKGSHKVEGTGVPAVFIREEAVPDGWSKKYGSLLVTDRVISFVSGHRSLNFPWKKVETVEVLDEGSAATRVPRQLSGDILNNGGMVTLEVEGRNESEYRFLVNSAGMKLVLDAMEERSRAAARGLTR